MDLNRLRLFLRLADNLHFWKTAQEMNITQSALSRYVMQLEQELGFTLFDRTRRRVQLTAAGQVLRSEWTRLLTELEAAHHYARQVSAGEVGRLCIGHAGSVAYSWLPPALASFTARCPLVQLELLEVNSVDAQQQLLSYRVDIGFWREAFAHPALSSSALFTEPFALVVPEAHALQTETFTSLAECRNETFILPLLREDIAFAGVLRNLFEHYHFSPRYSITSNVGATILNLVAAGLGVSVLPLSYVIRSVKGIRYLLLPHQSTVFMTHRKADTSAVLSQFKSAINAQSFA